MSRTKNNQTPSLEEFELANSSYELLDHRINLKEYKRHRKLQKMIHKRQGWKAYTV